MIVCIPTIKHSGTHLMRESLFKDFKDASHYQVLNGDCEKGDYSIAWHVVDHNFDIFAEVMD